MRLYILLCFYFEYHSLRHTTTLQLPHFYLLTFQKHSHSNYTIQIRLANKNVLVLKHLWYWRYLEIELRLLQSLILLDHFLKLKIQAPLKNSLKTHLGHFLKKDRPTYNSFERSFLPLLLTIQLSLEF